MKFRLGRSELEIGLSKIQRSFLFIGKRTSTTSEGKFHYTVHDEDMKILFEGIRLKREDMPKLWQVFMERSRQGEVVIEWLSATIIVDESKSGEGSGFNVFYEATPEEKNEFLYFFSECWK